MDVFAPFIYSVVFFMLRDADHVCCVCADRI